MLGRANRRILALLGFSSVVHAGALLAYGYLYPAAPQVTAATATATLQLQLQPLLAPQARSGTALPPAINPAATQAGVVVTLAHQAAFSIDTRRIGTAALMSPQPSSVIKQPAPESPVMVKAIEGAQGLLTDSQVKQDAVAPRRAVPPVKSVATAPVSQKPEWDHSDRVTPETETSAIASQPGAASNVAASSRTESELPGSAQSASINRRIGEQLLQALASYFSYPIQARRKGWQGEVLLRVDIGSNGEVVTVRLASSSGYAALDRAALKSMKQVAEIDLAALDLASIDQPLQLEIPVAYQLVN